MAKKTTDMQSVIDRMARRIVRRFRPEKVILFGSHARGDAGPDSDVDLLVVMEVEGSKHDAALAVRLLLHDIRVPKDVIVTTPEDFAWRKDIVGTIEYPATHEGRSLYDKSRPSHLSRSRVDRESRGQVCPRRAL